MVNNVVDRYRDGCFVALYDHAKRVTDQNQVGSGSVYEGSEAGVVGRQAGYGLALLLHLSQARDIDRRIAHAALFKLGIHSGASLATSGRREASGGERCAKKVGALQVFFPFTQRWCSRYIM